MDRPSQFSGISRFTPVPRPGAVGASSTPAASASSMEPRGTPQASGSTARPSNTPAASTSSQRPSNMPLGSASTPRGLAQFQRAPELGRAGTARRHMRKPKDSIRGISVGDIKRLARRGGVKRISKTMYDEIRVELKRRLERVIRHAAIVVESGNRKTITVTDVVFTLNRLGNPTYGFDPGFIRER